MKLRLLIVILIVAALFSGVVLWRVDRFVYGVRISWAEAQARSQVSSLNQAIRTEIQSARRLLSNVNSDTFKKEKTNWNSFQPYYAVALMTNQGGVLGISQMTTRSDSPAASWTQAQLGQYIGFMGKELESRGTVLLRAFKDPKKNMHVATVFVGGGHAYILVGSGGNFQSLIESQRGSINSFAIVASDGLTISHATPEYIGTVMGDSTLMKEIRSTGSAQGLGTYLQGKKQVFGLYEQVPGSSAYVISTVPIEELLRGRLSLAWQFVFLAIGVSLIGTAGYFWYDKRSPRPAMAIAPVLERNKQEVLPPIPSVSMENVISPPPPVKNTSATGVHSGDVITSNAALVAPIAPKNPPPPSPVSHVHAGPPAALTLVTPPDLQQEKAEAYRQVAAAMGQEMRAPLASILGFSQMVLSKTQEPEVVQAVESILREARSSRDVLDKLVTFSGERDSQKSEIKIEGPLMQALKNFEPRLQQKGVRVEKDFQETAPWALAGADIVKVFENIIENSIEAMERMQDKSLRISTWESAEGLHVRFIDTGEGIDRENLGKVFDPFFTTRSYSNHVGLGLPVAAGILKEHQAQFRIQSQRANGTEVDIIFPPSRAAVAASANRPAPPPMRAADLPMQLPKAAVPIHEEAPQEKLTDRDLDSLFELPAEEAPLQFLEGMGFNEPPPAVPSPKTMAIPPPSSPPPPPPQVVAAPPPPPTAPPSAIEVETETEKQPSLIIDRPATSPPPVKNSALDSYKVEVKRPGKRT